MLHMKKLLPVFIVIALVTLGCVFKKEDQTFEEDELFTERDQIQKAMEQEFIMTVDPALGYIPKERLIAALNYERDLQRRMRGTALTWQERGPNNVAGRTRAFIIDSRDATGNTVFAASVSGGIWKATNFKAANPTWTPVNENMGSLAVGALAQDPSNPATIYAGTGEGWFNVDAVRGNGIWKSSDGGNTWNKLPSTDSTVTNSQGQTLHPFDYVQDIVVNSQGVVFASTRPNKFCNVGGVLRSSDGGTTWSRVIGTTQPWATTCAAGIYNYYAADLELASNGDVYATTGYNNSGAKDTANYGRIFRSGAATNGTNVGNAGTWVDITPTGAIWQRIEIAVAPNSPNILYALLEGQGNGIGAIKKSADYGATWTDLPLPNWCNQGANSTDFTNGQAFYNLIVQVDPNNANTVYIGGIDLLKSTDGGTTWTQVTQWARNCNNLPIIHADQHNLQFFPGSSSEIIAANDGGIYYSDNGGTSWATSPQPNLNGANQTTISLKNIGYNITQLYACAVHPTISNYFLIGAQDNGSQKLTAAGIGSGIEASVGGDGGYCHIDQVDGNIQILSYIYNNYYYSRDNGASFKNIKFNNGGYFINPSDYDNVKKVLYTSSTPGNLGVVSNLSGTGTPTFTDFPVSGLGIRKISAVKVDPNGLSGGTIWISGYDSTGSLKPILIKLTTANNSPSQAIATTLSAAPTGAFISSIDVDPADFNHLLITLSNYGIASVYESTDGGTSFTSLDNNNVNLPDIPVRWGMFVPANASVNGTTGGGILLATEIGVFYAQNTAGTLTAWTPQNTNLPTVRTDMLRYRASDRLVAAATHGRGLFTTTLTSIATGIPTINNTQSFIKYAAATQQQLIISAGNLNLTKMNVRIFDLNGRLVLSKETKYADQTIPISTLARSTYLLKIYGTKGEQYTLQFVK